MALNLEVFKKMSKKEIKEYGESLPTGFICDDSDNILSYKDSNGFWYEYTYDENGTELTYKNSSGYWDEYTRDEHGRELTFKNSRGYWREYTYDKKGYVLTLKNSDRYWYEYTRDKRGNMLTYKNSSGVDVKTFFWGKKYNLGYDTNSKKYKAGCQYLTYEECEEFYENYKYEYKDSHNFIEAIREHQKSLTESK